MYFVALHLDKTSGEIEAAAKADGRDVPSRLVSVYKAKLRTHHGITKPILTEEGAKQLDRARRRSAGTAPKSVKAKKKSAAAPASTSTAPDDPKAAALRRLIFELGFDTARAVFMEFEQLHKQMR